MKKIILYNFLLLCFAYADIYTGYVKTIDMSFCMSECSEYYLEDEQGAPITNIMFSDAFDPLLYIDRFVTVQGEEYSCIECSAIDIQEISLSYECNYPVSCFVDPCEVAQDCQLNTPVECTSNYCGGCYADFYDLNGDLVDCYSQSVLPCDDLGDLFFGWCDMYLGVAIVNGECQGVSGCGWSANGIDYSDAFFNSFSECESACLNEPYVCEYIEYDYGQLHSGDYILCEEDSDCISVWGDCGVGLGGCHYSVNEQNYHETAVDHLVNLWTAANCMQWACDCFDLPGSVCNDGTCELAYCLEENPAGCFSTGCSQGYACIDYEEAGDCVPSTCYCDEYFGTWYCTEDCNGGTCFELGDVNYDANINIVDVVTIVNIILGLSIYTDLSDVDLDGTVNVIDVIILVNRILN